jgi:hypothetical protein
LALHTLLYGCGTWAIREHDKSRITSAEMKFMSKTSKHTRKDYKTNENILSELKINPVVNKIQNYGNKCVHLRKMDRG